MTRQYRTGRGTIEQVRFGGQAFETPLNASIEKPSESFQNNSEVDLDCLYRPRLPKAEAAEQSDDVQVSIHVKFRLPRQNFITSIKPSPPPGATGQQGRGSIASIIGFAPQSNNGATSALDDAITLYRVKI